MRHLKRSLHTAFTASENDVSSEFIYTALTNYPFKTLNWRSRTQNNCPKISQARICCNATKSVGGHKRLAVCLDSNDAFVQNS